MAALRFEHRRRKAIVAAAVVLLTLIGGVYCCFTVLNSWRYEVPPSFLLRSDQSAAKLAVEQRTGVTLPQGTRVLRAPDDLDDKSATWVLYVTASKNILPFDENLNRFVWPSLSRHVTVIENGIAPYKVLNPKNVTYHRWTSRNVDNQASVVTAETGQYIFLQTFRHE